MQVIKLNRSSTWYTYTHTHITDLSVHINSEIRTWSMHTLVNTHVHPRAQHVHIHISHKGKGAWMLGIGGVQANWSRIVTCLWYVVTGSLALRRISCHGRNPSHTRCEYSQTIFLCYHHYSEYSLLESKFSTNLLFAASKCHVTIQRQW